MERAKHNCHNFLYHLRRHVNAAIAPGRPCAVSNSIVSADDWETLFWDAGGSLLESDGYHRSSDVLDLGTIDVATPPTASTQMPGYPTLSDVARLHRNNQENTPPGRSTRGGHQDGGGPIRGPYRGVRARNIFDH